METSEYLERATWNLLIGELDAGSVCSLAIWREVDAERIVPVVGRCHRNVTSEWINDRHSNVTWRTE